MANTSSESITLKELLLAQQVQWLVQLNGELRVTNEELARQRDAHVQMIIDLQTENDILKFNLTLPEHREAALRIPPEIGLDSSFHGIDVSTDGHNEELSRTTAVSNPHEGQDCRLEEDDTGEEAAQSYGAIYPIGQPINVLTEGATGSSHLERPSA